MYFCPRSIFSRELSKCRMSSVRSAAVSSSDLSPLSSFVCGRRCFFGVNGNKELSVWDERPPGTSSHAGKNRSFVLPQTSGFCLSGWATRLLTRDYMSRMALSAISSPLSAFLSCCFLIKRASGTMRNPPKPRFQ